ncbi:hypothetical protein ABKN59_003212 [Abortiporus biennis]
MEELVQEWKNALSSVRLTSLVDATQATVQAFESKPALMCRILSQIIYLPNLTRLQVGCVTNEELEAFSSLVRLSSVTLEALDLYVMAYLVAEDDLVRAADEVWINLLSHATNLDLIIFKTFLFYPSSEAFGFTLDAFNAMMGLISRASSLPNITELYISLDFKECETPYQVWRTLQNVVDWSKLRDIVLQYKKLEAFNLEVIGSNKDDIFRLR